MAHTRATPRMSENPHIKHVFEQVLHALNTCSDSEQQLRDELRQKKQELVATGVARAAAMLSISKPITHHPAATPFRHRPELIDTMQYILEQQNAGPNPVCVTLLMEYVDSKDITRFLAEQETNRTTLCPRTYWRKTEDRQELTSISQNRNMRLKGDFSALDEVTTDREDHFAIAYQVLIRSNETAPQVLCITEAEAMRPLPRYVIGYSL